MLTCLVRVLLTFYIQSVLKLKNNNSGAKRLNCVLHHRRRSIGQGSVMLACCLGWIDCYGFLGSFAKLRKATISFVVSASPSVCPRGKIRLPLDEFLWNSTFEVLSKTCRKFYFQYNVTRITGTSHEGRCTLMMLLLQLALQPTVGFGLSNIVLPFFPICHQLSPSSPSQHLKISFYFLFPSFPGSFPPSRPFQFLSETLFGHPIFLHSL